MVEWSDLRPDMKESAAMRDRQRPEQPPAVAPAPAPARVLQLEEITFDVGAFLGDDLSGDQLLQSLLEAPPASVPAAPPAQPLAAAVGQTSSSCGSGSPRLTPAQRVYQERLKRFLQTVRVPACVPKAKKYEASLLLFNYYEAQRPSELEGNISLHKFAKKNNHLHLERYSDLLIELKHKTHVHTQNRHGETPLHVVTGAASARVLLERGARRDAVDKLGNTPIHLAARHQRVDVLAVLLEWEPLPDYSLLDKKNLEGYTALHLVVIHQPLADTRRRALELLLENHVDVNVADDTGGRSALFHAVLRGDELAVRELVENGASVNLADFSETTPLQAAEDVLPADDNHICSILLERGGFKVPPADRVTQTGRRAGGSRRRAT